MPEVESGGAVQSAAELVRFASMSRWSSDKFDGVAWLGGRGGGATGGGMGAAAGGAPPAGAPAPTPKLPAVMRVCGWKIIPCGTISSCSKPMSSNHKVPDDHKTDSPSLSGRCGRSSRFCYDLLIHAGPQ